MKKGLLVVLSTSLLLVSCGEEPNTTKDFETVVKETQSSIVSQLTPDFNIVKEGTSSTDMEFNMTVPDEEVSVNINGKIDSEYNMDNNESHSVISLEGLESFQGEELSGDFKGEITMAANTIYGKLTQINVNSLTGMEDIAQFNAIITPFLDKWYSVELDEDTLQLLGLDSQKTLLKFKEFGDLFAETPLFDLVQENEDADYYNYDVEINTENLFLLIKKYYSIVGVEIPGTVKVSLEDGLSDSNTEINLKVEKADTSNFIITIQDPEGEYGKMEIKNSKDQIIIDIYNYLDSQEVKIVIDKSDTEGITGKLSIIENEEVSDLLTFVYKFARLQTKVGLNLDLGKMSPEMSEGTLMNISFDTTIKEKNVEITAPENSQNMTPLITPYLEQLKMLNQMGTSDYYDDYYENDSDYEYDYNYEDYSDDYMELTPEEQQQLDELMGGE